MNWFEVEEIKPKGVEVVKLDPKNRKGELTFKVTNVSGKALRAGAVVFPHEDEQRAWTSIKGEEIQEMGEDAEKTFRVGIAAPTDAEPGTYPITFVVCNEANPEEETAEVKAEFKIETRAEQAVSRVQQDWLHCLAAVLIGVVVGLIVWYLWPGRKAKFSVDRREGPAYLMVQFKDQSGGKPHSWLWDFGDGHTSVEQNPIHFYGLDPNQDPNVSYPKKYPVSLTINDKESTRTTRRNYINVAKPELNADFEIYDAAASGIREAIAYVGDTVTFHNLSTGLLPGEEYKFKWYFDAVKDPKKEDSHDVNPTYNSYNQARDYKVILAVCDGYDDVLDVAEGTVRILKPIKANFEHKRVYAAAEPYAVQFTDKSEGEPQSWDWDFGDGSTSDERNPIHNYKSPGEHNVTLIVRGQVGNITELEPTTVKEVTVDDKKPEELIAAFSCDPPQGKAPLRVYFTDRSLGRPNSWEWKFVDITSNEDNSATDELINDQDPINYFENPGIYAVTLTVKRESNGKVEDEKTINVPKCIMVTKEAMSPVAECTVRRALSESGTAYVPTYPARFTFAKKDPADDNSGQAIEPVSSIKIQRGDTVEFMDLSKGDVKNRRWYFGDGTHVSDKRDPTHIFNRVGNFAVSLMVTGPEGTGLKKEAAFVKVCPRTKVEIIEPNEILNEILNMEVYPQRLFKGSDFGGPGKAKFNVTAMLKKEGRDVYAYLSMYVKKELESKKPPEPDGNTSVRLAEGLEEKAGGTNMVDPNMVVARGIVTKRIFTAPEGWKVNRIITTPTSLFWAGTDKARRIDYEEREMLWCEFAVMGDTPGNDFSQEEADPARTHMIVQIREPIKIELIEE